MSEKIEFLRHRAFAAGEGAVACREPIRNSEPIAMVDVWDAGCLREARVDGIIGGFRALPNVIADEWRRFSGETKGYCK